MNNKMGRGYDAMCFRRPSIAMQHDINLINLSSQNKDTVSINLFSSNKVKKMALFISLS